MTRNRILGLQSLFTFCLAAFVALLFVVAIQIEDQWQIYGLTDSNRPWVYFLGAIAAIFIPQKTQRAYLHDVELGRFFEAFQLSLKIVLTQGLIFSLIYISLKDVAVSRGFIIGYLGLCLITLPLLILTIPKWLKNWVFPPHLRERAVLLVQGQLPDNLLKYLGRCESLGITFQGYFSDEPDAALQLEYLGPRQAFFNYQGPPYTRVLACQDNYCDVTFKRVIRHAESSGLHVQIYTRFANAFPEQFRIHSEGELHFFVFQEEVLENPIHCLSKRVLDILIAIPVVALILPPLAFVIRLMQQRQSPGPLLFKQI